MLSLGNILWVILFGWMLAVVYLFAGAIMYLSWAGRPYARLCWMLAKYFLWPFGKFLMVCYTSFFFLLLFLSCIFFFVVFCFNYF